MSTPMRTQMYIVYNKVKAVILSEHNSFLSRKIAESDVPNITIVGIEKKHRRMQCLSPTLKVDIIQAARMEKTG